MEFALQLTVIGLFVVFVALILLITLIGGFSGIFSLFRQKTSKKTEQTSVEAPVYPVAEIQSDEVPAEIVAAITAALSVMLDTKKFTIQKIRRQKSSSERNAWGFAGVAENTRPF